MQKRDVSAACRAGLTMSLVLGLAMSLTGCGLFGADTPQEAAAPTPPPVRSVLANKPVDPRAEQLHAKARVLWGAGEQCSDPEQAIAYLNSALEIAPDYPDALMRRGLAFAQLGHPEDAFEDLTRAIRSAPTAELYAWRAQLLLTMGILKGAMQDADEALKLGPTSAQKRDEATPRAYNVRGAVLLEEGNTEAACAAFKKAADAGVDVYWNKARTEGICK